MQIHSISNCCTSKLLIGFGRCSTAGDFGNQPDTYESHKKELLKYIKSAKIHGEGTLIAFTTTSQHKGNAALRDVGFKSDGPFKSRKHRSETILWWLPVYTWTKDMIKDPEEDKEEDEDR